MFQFAFNKGNLSSRFSFLLYFLLFIPLYATVSRTIIFILTKILYIYIYPSTERAKMRKRSDIMFYWAGVYGDDQQKEQPLVQPIIEKSYSNTEEMPNIQRRVVSLKPQCLVDRLLWKEREQPTRGKGWWGRGNPRNGGEWTRMI